jgi:hypothetical protein
MGYLPLDWLSVPAEAHGLCAIAFPPRFLFWQADAHVGSFCLLIQMVVVDEANVLALGSVDMPTAAILSRTTPLFLELLIELLSAYANEWLVGLVVVFPLFKIQPTEEILVVGVSAFFSKNDACSG